MNHGCDGQPVAPRGDAAGCPAGASRKNQNRHRPATIDNNANAHDTTRRYRPIADYAAIGDCHGLGLVALDGSVDWLCLQRFDADPQLAALLDADRGGCFHIQARGAYRAKRRYLHNSNVLCTEHHTDAGTLCITDFMPVGRRPGSTDSDFTSLIAPFWLVRMVECTAGRCDVEVALKPLGAQWGKRPVRMARSADGVEINAGYELQCPGVALDLDDGRATGRFALAAGQRQLFVLSHSSNEPDPAPTEQVDAMLASTLAFWREWLDQCAYTGPWREPVFRSLLALKLLSYAPTGAVVAAGTTSLPEAIGGERNWDYRYAWLRDSAFTLYDLAATGFHQESGRYMNFFTHCLKMSRPDVCTIYSVTAQTDIDEQIIDLAGYRNSQPVRIGNAAVVQEQMDMYGEVLDAAALYQVLGGQLSDMTRRLFRRLADYVERHWRQPGHGIWEMRDQPRHHTYSKLMCWVAMDRAARLFGEDREHFMTIRAQIHDDIMANAVCDGHLCHSYGHEAADAAVLMAPRAGFSMEPDLLRRTIDYVRRELEHKGFLRRYQVPDGISGPEAAFLPCNFWLADALVFAGERDEAIAVFEHTLGAANDVGLLSEAYDPDRGELLGNFPQGLSHLGLLRTALLLHLQDMHGADALDGEHVHLADPDHLSGMPGLWDEMANRESEPRQATSASILKPCWVSLETMK